MKFSLVAAVDEKMGIGINNSLPWRLKGDLKYFSEVTTGSAPEKINAVIMGRKTWDSLPEAHRPLKGRLNAVLSRNKFNLPDGVLAFNSLESALDNLSLNKKVDQVFVIGGASVFQQAILHNDCQKIFLTEILQTFDCDTFFPKIPGDFKKVSETPLFEENGLKYRFLVYEKG